MSAFTDASRLSILDRMLLMRYFEEAVIRLYNDGKFSAHYHVYIGQEATGAAVLEALGPDDVISTTHRNHGHFVGRGGDPGRALAEILGRGTGVNRGRAGTLHLSDRSLGFLSTSAVVGGCAGLATGGAYGLKTTGKDAVSVAFFGDGALEEGIVYETFNVAALWKLPLIYICENNSAGALGQQAGGYPSLVSAASQLARIPECFGIKTHVIDGTDPSAVLGAVRDARAQCLAGEGPVFIETMTVRWPGSNPLWPELATETDIAAAWKPDRITGSHAEWVKHYDPLLRMARHLLDDGLLSENALHQRDLTARRRIDEAVDFALASPFPIPSTACDGVFA